MTEIYVIYGMSKNRNVVNRILLIKILKFAKINAAIPKMTLNPLNFVSFAFFAVHSYYLISNIAKKVHSQTNRG